MCVVQCLQKYSLLLRIIFENKRARTHIFMLKIQKEDEEDIVTSHNESTHTSATTTTSQHKKHTT